MFALEPTVMRLRSVSLSCFSNRGTCGRRMEVLTGPAREGPWTSVFQFTSQNTNNPQTFSATDDTPALSGFVNVVVHDAHRHDGTAYTRRESSSGGMKLEGEAFG